jgi:signal transduction histidine kinase/ActR/RegA family two-component response regulator
MILKNKKSKWFDVILISPILFIVAFSLFFSVILYLSYNNVKKQQLGTISNLSKELSSKIELKLKGNLDYLNLLAKERANGYLSEDTFQTKIKDYLVYHPEFINITWIDSNYVIKTVAPLKENSNIIGLHIELPEPKQASQLARLTRKAVYTKPFEAIQSNSSFEVWIPVFNKNKFLGLFSGVYSTKGILKSCFSDLDDQQIRISLVDENSKVLGSFSKSYSRLEGDEAVVPLVSLGNGMGIKIEMINKNVFGWTMIIFVSLILVLVLSYAYSLYKISIENKLRKEMQSILEKNESILKKQNLEYASLNQEYEIQNKNLKISKEKAEQSDRLKSAFLANMSHEIRTPMNGILGFSELLKKPNLTGKQQQQYVEIIAKSGVRMLNILNDIIDISKIESGLMEVDIKEFDVNEKMECLYNLFKPEAEGKNLDFSVKKGLSSDEVIIHTDRLKVSCILSNLVKNAIKYCDKGSVEVGYERKGNYLEFYVKDTGIGIPIERQKAIFKRFIQADIQDREARQGAGLGLSIAKAYVKLLGGKIWVESQPEKGSTFYFTLPIVANKEEKKVAITEIPTNKEVIRVENLKILIAEDDKISELFISKAIKMFSKEIITVQNGKDAVEIYRKNQDIDLILMDIGMPIMDGYEATRQIREFDKQVIIIAQTAYGLANDREKALQSGCNDYISKPINKEELYGLINKYFLVSTTKT